jgi:PKD repeat protein
MAPDDRDLGSEQVTWDWGDGTVEYTDTTVTEKAHTYADDGDYTVTVSVGTYEGGAAVTAPAPGAVEPAPVVSSLEPNAAKVGDPDFTLNVVGEGFDADTVIVWNHADEPTTLVDDTIVTTIVKPSTALGPCVLPVQVRSGTGVLSGSVDFTFTEAEAPPAPQRVAASLNPTDHNVADVLNHLDAHPEEAEAIYDAELMGKARITLLSDLEERLGK